MVSVGSEVRDLVVGQRVWGSNQGLMGEGGDGRIRVDRFELGISNSRWSLFEQAAACAWWGLPRISDCFREGNLKPNDWVFRARWNGGVGSMVVQMAKASGKVVTTAGSKEGGTFVASWGQTLSSCTANPNVTEIERAFALGCAVVLGTLREPDFDFAVANLAERGRMI